MSEGPRYELSVGEYDTCLSNFGRDVFRNHNKQALSTFDMDQDASLTLDCSKHHANNGGWWFYNCFEININGQE